MAVDVDTIMELVSRYGQELYVAGTMNALKMPEARDRNKALAEDAYNAILEALNDDEEDWTKVDVV